MKKVKQVTARIFILMLLLPISVFTIGIVALRKKLKR